MYKHTPLQLLKALEDLRDGAEMVLEGSITRDFLETLISAATDVLNANHPEVEAINSTVRMLLKAEDGTFSLAGAPVSYDSGYQVGGVLPGLVDPSRAELTQWVESVRAQYPGSRSVFYGVWVDPGTGERCIDLTERMQRPLMATLACHRRGEQAYWDWARSECVMVEGA